MSMIEILFNMNTEQSVNAGHHAGLLERTGGKGPGRVCGRAFVFRWRLLDYRTSVERDPKLIGSLLRWSGGR